MGADLMFSICEMEATKEQAYNNARHLSATERYINTVTFLEDMGVTSRWYDTEPTPEDVQQFLIDCIDEVYSSQRRRDCGLFHVDKREFYITAGMSWGDAPTDAWDEFSVCEALGLTLNQPNLDLS